MPAAQKPIRLFDSRGRDLWCNSGGSDRLIGPSRQNYDRKRIPLLDHDFHRNVSSYGRRTLLSLGRNIYFASSAVRGAVEDQCTHAAGTYMFESRSADPAFKRASEHLLYQHDRVCDIAGPPYKHRTWRKLIIRAHYTDGGLATVCVLGKNGLPQLQTIPAHRIGSDKEICEGGPHDGARIIDGVIVDDNNAPLAYRVRIDGDPGYIDISTASMTLHFVPIFAGQLRELSILGLAAWDMQDLDEARRWELLAQKAAAGRVFIEFNERGEAPVGSDFITGPTAGSATDATPTGLWEEHIDGGSNTYFKANTGSDLKAVEFNRPHANQQAFAQNVLREAFAASRLSWDFHLDLSKLNGGPLRLLCEKINVAIDDLRQDLLEPACRRFDFFRLGTFIAQGHLPAAPDWTDWEYQGARKFTPDRGHENRVILDSIRAGIMSRARGAADGDESIDDVRNAKEREADDLFTRVKRIAARHPEFTLQAIMDRLESDNSTRSAQPEEEEKAAPPPRETQPAR